MIELTFGESAAGAIAMTGDKKDVGALTLALDIGDISDMDTGMNTRKKLLEDLFADFPDVSGIWKVNQHTMARLKEAIETQEPVRIWICASNPEELCGLYFVCHVMMDAKTPLSVVRIPDQIEEDDCIVSYRNTGEIIPEVLGAYTKYEKPISGLQKIVYANTWRSLVHENAPLRVVLNGSLIGVPSDFYDFALRANMPEGEFVAARLIGKILNHIPGIGDRWLFLRIQKMLQSGELITVSAATEDHPYSEIIKRSSER